MPFKKMKLIILGALLAVLAGCASSPEYKNIEQDPLVRQSHTFHASLSHTHDAVEQTFSQYGFSISGSKPHHILAVTHYQPEDDDDTTTIITADVKLNPNGSNQTDVSIGARQRTIERDTSHTYFHLLFIPIIPTGTVHSAEVADKGVVDDDEFFDSFFSAVQANI